MKTPGQEPLCVFKTWFTGLAFLWIVKKQTWTQVQRQKCQAEKVSLASPEADVSRLDS